MGRQRYRRPPVVEALCEISFEGTQWDPTVPGLFFESIRNDFPRRQTMNVMEALVRLDRSGEVGTAVQPKRERMQFLNEQGNQIVQIAEDILVVNQLPPYSRFEEWEPLILRVLAKFEELARPRRVSQVGVRYLNRITIEGGPFRMEDYFRYYPTLPASLGDEHGAFMIRVDLAGRATDEVLLLTLATTPDQPVNGTALLLDLYSKIQVPMDAERDLVPDLVRVAQRKCEQAFEASITDALRTRFQPEA